MASFQKELPLFKFWVFSKIRLPSLFVFVHSILLYSLIDRADSLGQGAQDGHLDFHTAPELCFVLLSSLLLYISSETMQAVRSCSDHRTTQLLSQLLCRTVTKTNVCSSAVGKQLKQKSNSQAQLYLLDLFWANLWVQHHLPPHDLAWTLLFFLQPPHFRNGISWSCLSKLCSDLDVCHTDWNRRMRELRPSFSSCCSPAVVARI